MRPGRLKFGRQDAAGNKDHTTRGAVQLVLRWRHNPGVAFKPFEMKEPEEDGSEDEDEDDVEGGADANPDAKKPDEGGQEEEAKKAKEDAAKEEAKKLSKEQETFKVISGDYQIHVHVIECRDLRPKNLNGTSDPVVSVEAFGQKQNTAVVESTLSPVFDDLLIFNLKGMEFGSRFRVVGPQASWASTLLSLEPQLVDPRGPFEARATLNF